VSASNDRLRDASLAGVACTAAALAGAGAGSWALAACRAALSRNGRLAGAGTLIFAGGLMIAVAIPGLQLVQRSARVEAGRLPS
jgi:hypothetical protein